jgi:GNAT superfamily N-acetyltransferase
MSTTSNPANAATKSVNLRRAHFVDQQSMARALSLAFWDDVLFGHLIHPHREQYPHDSDLYWLRRIQVNWWDWSHVFLVTTDVDEKTRSEVVTGVAHWSRMGKTGATSGWLDPTNVALPIAKACTALASWWWPNRAADPAQEDIIERSYSFLDHVWTGSRAQSWYLEALGVHPDYQNRGLGRALVKWGLDQAEREGVSASVIAADGKESFYQRCGFDVGPIGRSGEGQGNPLSEVPGGLIFFKEAGGKEARESAT